MVFASLKNLEDKRVKKEFILKDLSRQGISVSDLKRGDYFGNKWIWEFARENWGRMVLIPAGNQYGEINPTGPPGYTSSIYYPLMFWLRRQGFQTEKADETIDVTPMHSAYYQVTMKQKEDLEAKIKAGIASAAQAVSDFELLSHDERKYREFLRYYGYRTKKELDKEAKKEQPETIPDDYDELDMSESDDKVVKRRDEHALKAFFIDQVDQHTGDVSLRNIVQRWPTIITDFMRVKDEYDTIDNLKSALGISRAEAVVLLTKNKLYKEWKTMFFPEVKKRYDRIKELITSRNSSIKQYREWVKPYVAKHNMIKEELGSEGGRTKQFTTFIKAGGHAVSMINVEIWLWKDFQSQEYYLAPGEMNAYQKLPAYDEWTKHNLIWHPHIGLVASHPWITKKWVDDQIKGIEDKWMSPYRNYYTFIILSYTKTNIRFPDGSELEDGIFGLNALLMSKNVLLAKLLELKAKQYEFEKHINDLLGVPSEFAKGPKEEWKPDKSFTFPLGMRFFKHGPYENALTDRITRMYLIPMGRTVFAPIGAKIKDLAGYGKD